MSIPKVTKEAGSFRLILPVNFDQVLPPPEYRILAAMHQFAVNTNHQLHQGNVVADRYQPLTPEYEGKLA